MGHNSNLPVQLWTAEESDEAHFGARAQLRHRRLGHLAGGAEHVLNIDIQHVLQLRCERGRQVIRSITAILSIII